MATRILIIDDYRDTADFLKLLVEPRGDLARTAAYAVQAREILRSWRPEVVLMDLMLPDADGIELLKDFKEASPETQVIMVTGYGSVPKAVEAMRCGAFSFIEKPVDAGSRPRNCSCRPRTGGFAKNCGTRRASRTSSRAATRCGSCFT